MAYAWPVWLMSLWMCWPCIWLMVRAAENATHTYHIGALFQQDQQVNSSILKTYLDQAINDVNSRSSHSVTYSHMITPFVNLYGGNLWYLCTALKEHNVTAFFALGDQNTLNALSIVTHQLGIPVIGYNTDKRAIAIQGEKPLYLHLDPSKALMAKALVKLMEVNHWFYASLISEDSYATDGFLDTFRLHTSNTTRWRVEDYILLSRRFTDTQIDHKLLNLLENRSRVVILHCSAALARRVFKLALANGFTKEGYAWFVTEDVVTTDEPVLQADYPIGLVAVTLDYSFHLQTLVTDVTHLIAKSTEQFVDDHGDSLDKFAKSHNCYAPQFLQTGLSFYRYLKKTEVIGREGPVGFDSYGLRTTADLRFHNLIPVDHNDENSAMKWLTVGTYRNDTVKINTIVWPGSTISGPITHGQRTLRVVTNVVEPFVMQQTAIDEGCTTGVPCLQVNTKNKDTLDDIFKDFERGVHNDSRYYEVNCCQGLSIMLLERLARDLTFKFQLYITADQRYGNLENGKWNGMVEDLLQGGAHMAVGAFSITKARSRVIDFSDPYFYSGFSILVSERKRKTPIYAFMEPFDGWVWISIVISATVVAVALSLLEWNSPFGLNPWGRKRKTNYTLGSGLNMVYAILFQHTIKTKSPKAWPSKWLQNFWAGVSIFIYSSYTANLAAFLAGKNSGVTVTGIHDPKLLEQGRVIGMAEGMAVEDFIRQVNMQLLHKTRRYPTTLPITDAVTLLTNATIDAYLDDTPVLEYARTSMDVKCRLRLVGQGFGDDAYGIGLPKHSWLKLPVTEKILQYHDSGFIQDLKDLYFRRSRCNGEVDDGQLQGEASPMVFSQHAGLYLLLAVGIFVCILLMFLEHATFKWMVPYWRSKPTKSFWKSISMLFWSQRMYRIITSEELVSPHHSAREMIEVVKNRDFTKLFQKSVKKKEKQARNKKNLFNVVEQLQWKHRREERLSQNPSMNTDCSQDSDNSATPVNLNRECHRLDEQVTTDTNDEGPEDWPKKSPRRRGRGWPVCESLSQDDGLTGPTPKDSRLRRPFQRQAPVVKYDTGSESLEFGASKSDDELLQSEPDPDPGTSDSNFVHNLIDVSDSEKAAQTRFDLSLEGAPRRFAGPGAPLLTQSSSSEDNLLSYSTAAQLGEGEYVLPNGMVILSPNGDVFARSPSTGKNILVRPKTFSNFKNFTTNLPKSMKTLPLKDNRVKSSLMNRSRQQEKVNNEGSINNDLEQEPGKPKQKSNLDFLSKEQLFLMWKTSEKELNMQLKKALREKAELEEKLASLRPESTT